MSETKSLPTPDRSESIWREIAEDCARELEKAQGDKRAMDARIRQLKISQALIAEKIEKKEPFPIPC